MQDLELITYDRDWAKALTCTSTEGYKTLASLYNRCLDFRRLKTHKKTWTEQIHLCIKGSTGQVRFVGPHSAKLLVWFIQKNLNS